MVLETSLRLSQFIPLYESLGPRGELICVSNNVCGFQDDEFSSKPCARRANFRKIPIGNAFRGTEKISLIVSN